MINNKLNDTVFTFSDQCNMQSIHLKWKYKNISLFIIFYIHHNHDHFNQNER